MAPTSPTQVAGRTSPKVQFPASVSWGKYENHHMYLDLHSILLSLFLKVGILFVILKILLVLILNLLRKLYPYTKYILLA